VLHHRSNNQKRVAQYGFVGESVDGEQGVSRLAGSRGPQLGMWQIPNTTH
jgi:hypothetical protein